MEKRKFCNMGNKLVKDELLSQIGEIEIFIASRTAKSNITSICVGATWPICKK